MNDSSNVKELQIPEFKHLSTRLGCEYCDYDCRHGRFSMSPRYGYSPSLLYRFDCERTVKRISIVKWCYEILVFGFVTALNVIYSSNFWVMLLVATFTFLFLLLFDLWTEHILSNFFILYEKRKKEKYDVMVKQMEEENKAIRRAKSGFTEEVEKFLENSKILHEKLSTDFETIKNNLVSSDKNEQRVILKFQEVLKELEILNSKLSKDNFDSSYITTLYEIHLPKLSAYSSLFIRNYSLNTLTPKLIVEFSNLLEVFRVKLSKHTEYLQQKVEDDFIIKMKALNEDVLPDFDGSEEQDYE